MQTGLILNALICFIIAVVSFWVFLYIPKHKKANLSDKYFAFFWFFVSLTWLFVGVDLILFEKNFYLYDLALNKHVVQPLIFIHLSIGSAYAFSRIWSKKFLILSILLIYLGISTYGLFFLFKPGGFMLASSTYFSVEYYINPKTWNIFQVAIVFGLLVLIFDLIKFIFKWFKSKTNLDFKNFLAGISLLIYAIIGYFDNQGNTATWIMVFFRLSIILTALITYLAYSKKEDEN